MEKALVAVIQEAWIAGVSTRRVDELVQAMGMTGIAKSSVSKLCKDLARRGLSGVKLVISRCARGPQGSDHPRAQRHLAALSRPLHAQRPGLRAQRPDTVVAAAIRQVFLQPDHAAATQVWRQVADQLRARWSKLGACMEEAEHDVLAYMTFPEQHRNRHMGQFYFGTHSLAVLQTSVWPG